MGLGFDGPKCYEVLTFLRRFDFFGGREFPNRHFGHPVGFLPAKRPRNPSTGN